MKTQIHHLPRALTAFLVAVLSARGAADYATPYLFSTLAGTSSIGSADGAGASARFYSPRAVATDAAGNVFIVDQGNHVIRKMTPAGVVATFAGSPGVAGSSDGTGSAARFDDPQDIAADAADNLYVTDTGNHVIRKITPAGVVTTFAGSAGVTGSTNGTGSAARFDRPRGIAADATGNLYVTESGNDLIRKITPAGVVSTFAIGKFPEPQDIGARFTNHYGSIAADAQGNVYVSTYSGKIFHEPGSVVADYYYLYTGLVLKISPAGASATLWGTSVQEYLDGRVSGTSVSDLAIDATGRLLAAGNFGLTRYTTTDAGSTFLSFAGTGRIGSSDGPPDQARFGAPFSIAYDRSGTLYVADTGNNTLRKVDANGNVTTVAGLSLENATGTADGTGAVARFTNPYGTAADPAGNVYVADHNQHIIRKITPAGVVTTLAGAPGVAGTADGTGSAARFTSPVGIAIDGNGVLYVTDNGSHVIRRVTPTGETSTFAGTPGSHGYADGTGAAAHFWFPRGIALDGTGNLYVTSSSTVRKITPAGVTTTLAGFESETGHVDGVGTQARFTVPFGIAVDAGGNVFVSEAPDSPAIARIRKIAPDGTVTTVAGAAHGYADGSGADARLHNPYSLAADATGNLFVAEAFNQTIRKITPQGAVSTIAGLADSPGGADGTGRDSRFYYPQGIAVDAVGALYVTSGTTVRKGVLATLPGISTQPANASAQAGNSASFSVTAGGTPAPAFQWQRNGTAISGATGSTLSLSNVQTADAGDYTVVVTNAVGSVTSAKATLTVTAAPVVTPPAPSGGGGGGGAPSQWFLLSLLSLAAMRRLARYTRG